MPCERVAPGCLNLPKSLDTSGVAAIVASSWHRRSATLLGSPQRCFRRCGLDDPTGSVLSAIEDPGGGAGIGPQSCAVVALGVVIRGPDTISFTYDAVTQGLTRYRWIPRRRSPAVVLTTNTESELDGRGLPTSAEDKGAQATGGLAHRVDPA